jgi:hypothetical protein
MKWAVVVAVLAFSAPAAGQILLETPDDARMRQNAERWQQYEQRRESGRDYPPLGGYQERLGDPAVRGVDRPGYTPPAPTPDAYGNRPPRYR